MVLGISIKTSIYLYSASNYIFFIIFFSYIFFLNLIILKCSMFFALRCWSSYWLSNKFIRCGCNFHTPISYLCVSLLRISSLQLDVEHLKIKMKFKQKLLKFHDLLLAFFYIKMITYFTIKLEHIHGSNIIPGDL